MKFSLETQRKKSYKMPVKSLMLSDWNALGTISTTHYFRLTETKNIRFICEVVFMFSCIISRISQFDLFLRLLLFALLHRLHSKKIFFDRCIKFRWEKIGEELLLLRTIQYQHESKWKKIQVVLNVSWTFMSLDFVWRVLFCRIFIFVRFQSKHKLHPRLALLWSRCTGQNTVIN